MANGPIAQFKVALDEPYEYPGEITKQEGIFNAARLTRTQLPEVGRQETRPKDENPYFYRSYNHRAEHTLTFVLSNFLKQIWGACPTCTTHLTQLHERREVRHARTSQVERVNALRRAELVIHRNLSISS